MVAFTSSEIIGWEIPPLQKIKLQPDIGDILSNSTAIAPLFSIGYNDAKRQFRVARKVVETATPRVHLPALWYPLGSPFTFQVVSHADGELWLASTLNMELPSSERPSIRDSLTLLSVQRRKLPLPYSRHEYAEVSFSSDFLFTSQSFYTTSQGTMFLLIPQASQSNADWTPASFTFPDGRRFWDVSVCPCSGRIVCSGEFPAGTWVPNSTYIYVFNLL